MTLAAEPTTVYATRRERARELGARYDFAQEPLRLYLALTDAHERAFERARDEQPDVDELAAYAVRAALPGVMEGSSKAGCMVSIRTRPMTFSRARRRRRCSRPSPR